MADAQGNRELSTETAEALLKAIKDAAPAVHNTGLESLARAYQLVHEAMPRPTGQARSARAASS